MKLLINHKISAKALNLLKDKAVDLKKAKVAQAQLSNYLKKHEIEAIVIGNDTEIHKGILDNCPALKLIINTVEDNKNVDLNATKAAKVEVLNTGNVAARSAAEMVFAHLFSGVRHLHNSNRDMPLEGETNFNSLQKSYANAVELEGKTLGILGLDACGIEVAKIATGLGMHVKAYDKEIEKKEVCLAFANGKNFEFAIETSPLKEVLKAADFVSLHLQPEKNYIISEQEIEIMPNHAAIINVNNCKLIDEVALVKALENNKLKFAGLDRFEKEPKPEIQILMNPAISLSPNSATTTSDVREKESKKIAELIIQKIK